MSLFVPFERYSETRSKLTIFQIPPLFGTPIRADPLEFCQTL